VDKKILQVPEFDKSISLKFQMLITFTTECSIFHNRVIRRTSAEKNTPATVQLGKSLEKPVPLESASFSWARKVSRYSYPRGEFSCSTLPDNARYSRPGTLQYFRQETLYCPSYSPDLHPEISTYSPLWRSTCQVKSLFHLLLRRHSATITSL
jgi:hypothetical protein